MNQSSSSPGIFFSRLTERFYGPLGLLIAALFILLNAPLGASLWLDETITSWLVSMGWDELIRNSMEYQAQSPFTFVLLWLWRSIFGGSEFMLRLPSLLAATGSLLFVYFIAKELVDKETGLWAALLFLCHESYLKSSVSARPYALALFFALASLWFLLRWLRMKDRRMLLGCALCTIAAFYSHYFFLGILAVQAIFVLFSPEWRKRLRPYALTVAAIAVAAMPGFLHLAEISSRQDLYSFRGLPSTSELLQAFVPPLLAIYVLVSAVFTFVVVRSGIEGHEEQRGALYGKYRLTAILLLWITLPPLLFFVYSHAMGSTLFFWRFYLWSAPGIALLLAVAMRHVAPQSSRAVAFCCVLLLIAIVPRRWSVEDWRAAVQIAHEELRQHRETRILAYTGLIELENVDWLRDSRRRPYLLAPLQVYQLDAPVIPIPSGFSDERAAMYFVDSVLPVLAGADRALLISAHMKQFSSPDGSGAMPEYFAALMEEKGFHTEYKLTQGSVWVLLISPRHE